MHKVKKKDYFSSEISLLMSSSTMLLKIVFISESIVTDVAFKLWFESTFKAGVPCKTSLMAVQLPTAGAWERVYVLSSWRMAKPDMGQ